MDRLQTFQVARVQLGERLLQLGAAGIFIVELRGGLLEKIGRHGEIAVRDGGAGCEIVGFALEIVRVGGVAQDFQKRERGVRIAFFEFPMRRLVERAGRQAVVGKIEPQPQKEDA